MYNNENDARYSSSYRQTQLPSAYRPPSAVGAAARHVHDVPPARTLPSKDLKERTNRWDRYPAFDSHERRNSPPFYHPSTTLHQHQSNQPTSRHVPPMRQYAYTPREVDHHEKQDLSVRKEYSPPRREQSVDGSFRGFTTPFPGCEAGRRNENPEDDLGRRPSYARQPSPSNQRFATHLSSAPNENFRGENDARYRDQYTNYNHHHQPPYARSSANEPYRHAADDQMRAAPEHRYTPSDVGSSISQRGRPFHAYPERRWEESSQYGRSTSVDPADAMSPADQSRLSPRTFQRECQRAYYEARNQRMRNLEEGLYGKCKWATYDSKYC